METKWLKICCIVLVLNLQFVADNLFGAAVDLKRPAAVHCLQNSIPSNVSGVDLCKYLQLIANVLLVQELLFARTDYYVQVYKKHAELIQAAEEYMDKTKCFSIMHDSVGMTAALNVPIETAEGFAFLLRHRDILYDCSGIDYKLCVAEILIDHENPDFQNFGKFLKARLNYQKHMHLKKGMLLEFDHIFFSLSLSSLTNLKNTEIFQLVRPFVLLKEYHQLNERTIDSKYPMLSKEDYYKRRAGMRDFIRERVLLFCDQYEPVRDQAHALYQEVLALLQNTHKQLPLRIRKESFSYLESFVPGERFPASLKNLDIEPYVQSKKYLEDAKKLIKGYWEIHQTVLSLKNEGKSTNCGQHPLTPEQLETIPDILRQDPVISKILVIGASLKGPDSRKLPTQPKSRLKSKKRKTKKSGNKIKKGPTGSVHVEIEQIDIKKPAIEIEPAGPADSLSLEVEVKDTAQLPQEQAPLPSSDASELIQPAPAPASQEELPQKNKIKPSALQKVPKKPVLCAASKNALVISASTPMPAPEGDYLIPQKTDSTKTTIYDARYNVELCMYISQDKRRPVFSFIDYTDTINLWLADPKKALRKKGYTDPESLWYRPDCRADLPTSDSHSLLRLELLHVFSKKIDAYIQRFGILGQIEEHSQTADSESGAEITTLTIPGHVLHCSSGITEPCLFVYYFHQHNNKWFHRNIVFRPYGLMTNEFLNNGFFKVPYPECNQ